VQAEEMRDVPVFVARVVLVFEPLLELAVPADLVWLWPAGLAVLVIIWLLARRK